MLHCNINCGLTNQNYDLVIKLDELKKHLVLNNLSTENMPFAYQFIGYKILNKISKEFSSLALNFSILSSDVSLNSIKYVQSIDLEVEEVNYSLYIGSNNQDKLQTFTQLITNYKKQLKLPKILPLGGTQHTIEFLGQIYNITLNEYITFIKEPQSCLAIKLNVNNNPITIYLSRNLLQNLIQYCLKINYLHKIDFDDFHIDQIATIICGYLVFKTNLTINLVNYSMAKVNNKEFAVVSISDENLLGGELFIDSSSLSKFFQLINYIKPQVKENFSKILPLNLKTRFPLEFGVSYLPIKDVQNIACGDIIFFDKCCSENINLEHIVLALSNNNNFTLDIKSGKVINYNSDW